MKLSDLFEAGISEGRSHPIIVVDVQPAYSAYDPETCNRIAQFVSKQTGPVLMFVNAELTGVTDDTVADIQHWWDERTDLDWDRVQIVDKGYGYFRAWMDNDVDPGAIIRVIRAMYQQNVSSSDQLFGGVDREGYDTQMAELVGDDYATRMPQDPMTIHWASVAQLKKFNGAYIVGGGRNECLREVELLMNAFNIRYKRIDSMVY